MISKEEWQDWQQNDVTKAFYQACLNRAGDAKEILVANAGVDAINDNFYRGFIAAYNEMTGFRVEDFDDES